MRFRRWARFRATMTGYFWLSCPLCGQGFGGHEWGDRDGRPAAIAHPDGDPGHGRGICPDCTRAGLGDPAHYIGIVRW